MELFNKCSDPCAQYPIKRTQTKNNQHMSLMYFLCENNSFRRSGFLIIAVLDTKETDKPINIKISYVLIWKQY